jgi:hypothetical protein
VVQGRERGGEREAVAVSPNQGEAEKRRRQRDKNGKHRIQRRNMQEKSLPSRYNSQTRACTIAAAAAAGCPRVHHSAHHHLDISEIEQRVQMLKSACCPKRICSAGSTGVCILPLMLLRRTVDPRENSASPLAPTPPATARTDRIREL